MERDLFGHPIAKPSRRKGGSQARDKAASTKEEREEQLSFFATHLSPKALASKVRPHLTAGKLVSAGAIVVTAVLLPGIVDGSKKFVPDSVSSMLKRLSSTKSAPAPPPPALKTVTETGSIKPPEQPKKRVAPKAKAPPQSPKGDFEHLMDWLGLPVGSKETPPGQRPRP